MTSITQPVAPGKSAGRPIIDCYVRNSTALQVDNWRAEYQKTELPRIVLEHGYEPQVWEEQGVSGETLEARPKILAILDRIKNKATIGIATVDFGRLSRDIDMIDGLKIWETCKTAGAIIITPGKVWHPGTAQDDDFAFITFWYESRNKRSVVTNLYDGLMNRAAAAPMFRGQLMYGYDSSVTEYKAPNGKLHRVVTWTINPADADVVREIGRLYLTCGMREIRNNLTARAKQDPKYAWRIKGHTPKRMIGELGWREQTIQRILHHPLYRGLQPVFRKRRTPLSRQAPIKTHYVPDLQILPDELSKAIDTVAGVRKFTTGGRTEPNSPYSKLLKCPQCGWYMSMDISPGGSPGPANHGIRRYYDCSQKMEYGVSRCTGCRLAVGAIHAAIVPLVREQLDRLADAELETRAEALLSGTNDALKAKRAEEEALRRGIADYNRDYYVTKKLPIPESIFLETMGAWSAQLAQVHKEIHDLETRRLTSAGPDVLSVLAELRSDLGDVLAGEPPAAQNTILKSLFVSVVLERGEGMVEKGTGYRFPARVVSYEPVYKCAVDTHSS